MTKHPDDKVSEGVEEKTRTTKLDRRGRERHRQHSWRKSTWPVMVHRDWGREQRKKRRCGTKSESVWTTVQ